MQNIKKIGGFVAILFLFIMLSFPLFIYAQNGNTEVQGPAQVQNTGIVYDCANESATLGSRPGECTFQDLINAVKKVVNWATLFALSFSVVVIAVAGARYMMSGDNAGERTKANKMLFSVVKGIVFILAAWLIVTLITNALVNPANITQLLQ